MTDAQQSRLDEVTRHYRPVQRATVVSGILFWCNAGLSLVMPYSTALGSTLRNVLESVFVVSVLTHFVLAQIIRLYLVPYAERMRRRQLLSDAFAAPLTYDHTSLYYNNTYSPSVQRLGANTMENALFSKEIAARMLIRKRATTALYVLAWVFAFTLRHNNLEVLTWITQLVFSGEILAEWLKLEVLRFRHERTYDALQTHFLHDLGERSPGAIASVLDAFVAYESAKSSAGILLSSKDFQALNPALTKQWQQIRRDLNMDTSAAEQQDAP